MADGSGWTYAPGSTFEMGAADVTLYAQWTQTYAISYDGNGSAGGLAPTDNNSYLQGKSVTVAGNTGHLEKPGYTFAGWNTAANGSGTSYEAGASFPMGASERDAVRAMGGESAGTGG